MRASGFPELAKEILALAGVRTDSAHEIVDFEIQGIRFVLMDGGIVEEGSMIFLCDIGMVPDACWAQVLRCMLETDPGTDTPCFSIDYRTNHVLLLGRLMIERTSARKLYETFVQYARRARQWRTPKPLFDETQSPRTAVEYTPARAESNGAGFGES